MNGRIVAFLREIKIELFKVTWPSLKQLFWSTVVVLTVAAISAAIIGAFDFTWSRLMSWILSVTK